MKKFFNAIYKYNIFRIIYVYISGIRTLKKGIRFFGSCNSAKSIEEAERIYEERSKQKKKEDTERSKKEKMNKSLV